MGSNWSGERNGSHSTVFFANSQYVNEQPREDWRTKECLIV